MISPENARSISYFARVPGCHPVLCIGGETTTMTGNQAVSLLGIFGVTDCFGQIRVAVPTWRRGRALTKAAAPVVSRDEIMDIFGDYLLSRKNDGLTERERQDKYLMARMRRAICA